MLVEEERCVDDACCFLPERGFFTPGAVCVGDFVDRIGKQRESEAVVIIELFLRIRYIGTDADNSDAEL